MRKILHCKEKIITIKLAGNSGRLAGKTLAGWLGKLWPAGWENSGRLAGKTQAGWLGKLWPAGWENSGRLAGKTLAGWLENSGHLG